MKTHFAVVNEDGTVLDVRSSASRSVGVVGKFGPYTHAITGMWRGNGDSPERRVVVSWSGSLQNAQREAHARSHSFADIKIMPVVVTAKRATVGEAL